MAKRGWYVRGAASADQRVDTRAQAVDLCRATHDSIIIRECECGCGKPAGKMHDAATQEARR